ncbi:sphingosine kinase 1-like [Actinia tenebrosa]|uniref:sphingosine kinase n=1 Tax=Actinia tenebrosa TaxID=6105 RepID=A0A6P8HTP4_ACTTE|nr:sphingosine kinase 1-like [Actinia tenebrosa]
MAESVMLQNCFQLLPGKRFYDVRLTREKLFYNETTIESCCKPSKNHLFNLSVSDIYGAKLFRSSINEDENAYIHIYICPVRGNKRIRRKIRFKVSGWEDLESNIKRAEHWIKTILWLIRNPSIDTATLKDKNLPPRRKLLVLVNPSSGQGKSLKVFQKKVSPMYKESSIDFELLVTEYAGHAKEIGLNLDVEQWDGIVICSGDGLVYELVNGLMNRPDWKRAIQMPIGVIPTGSGNALCYSALYASGEPFDVTAAIFATIIGQTHKLDICTIDTPNDRFFSFLSLTWGIISDVDLESEKHRYLGNARFTVGAVIRIIGLRTYRGRLSYLPMNNEHDEVTSSVDIPKEQLSDLDNDSPVFHSFGSPSGSFFPDENVKEERLGTDLPSSHENAVMLQSEKPSVNDISKVYKHHQGPDTPLLLPFEKHVPANWKTIQGTFILGSSVNLSHLGPDIMAAPEARFGDGVMHITYSKAGISRLKLLSLFNKMEDGSHVEADECVTVSAQAFRLEPDLSENGTLAIDGEAIPYSVVQGQIHKGLAQVMCSKSHR